MAELKLQRNVVLAVAAETTPGTRVEPTLATDRIQILAGAIPQRDYIARNSRAEFLTGSLSREPDATPVGEFVRIPIRFAPQGFGAAYTASDLPPAHTFLLGAGYAHTVDVSVPGSETVTYSLTDFPASSFSADYYVGDPSAAIKYALYGCVLENMTITCDAGGFPIMEATLMGVVSAVTDTTFTRPTYPDPQSLIWSGASALTLGAYSPQVQRVAFSLANTVAPNVDANATALARFQIVDRDPSAEIGIRVPALSTYDPRTLLNARTEFALDARFGVAGASGLYKRMNVASDRAYLRDVQPVLDGEFWNYTLTVGFAEDAVELDLVFD